LKLKPFRLKAIVLSPHGGKPEAKHRPGNEDKVQAAAVLRLAY
jgi:hypothetical protein